MYVWFSWKIFHYPVNFPFSRKLCFKSEILIRFLDSSTYMEHFSSTRIYQHYICRNDLCFIYIITVSVTSVLY